jgi:hypothetical protein
VTETAPSESTEPPKPADPTEPPKPADPTEPTEHSFPWRVTAVVAAIVIASTALAGLVLTRNSVEGSDPSTASIFTPAPDLLPIEKQRQVTVLVQVRDKDKDVSSSVLVAAGGDVGFVSQLLLPRTLLLPTVPPVLLKDTDGPRGPVRSDEALQTLLGVQIDANIELDRLAWAGLIDSTGALEDPAIGESAGNFPLVVARVLAKLPEDEETLGQLLTSMGSMAPTTVTNDDASHLLAVIGAALRTQPIKRAVLPTTDIRAGSQQAAVTMQPEAGQLVADLFPRALLQPGHPGPVRVVIERAGAGLGAIAAARLTLAGAGFGVVEGEPYPTPVSSTVVYVPDSSAASLSRGKDVAAALGLPATAVVVDTTDGGTVDVRLVLAGDYSPV